MTLQEIDWTKIGHALRESAMDAHGPENMPSVDMAYQFVLDNPECFGEFEEWPADMPQRPNIELIAAYYTPDAPTKQAPTGPTNDEYIWIKIGIHATTGGDGWDLKCGDDESRDVTGLQAERIMHAYCTECLDALQSVIDQAEPNVGDDRDEMDSEDESERHSGTPEHRSIG